MRPNFIPLTDQIHHFHEFDIYQVMEIGRDCIIKELTNACIELITT